MHRVLREGVRFDHLRHCVRVRVLVGADEVRVQLSDRFMEDPVAGKWIGFCDLRGGGTAGADCGEFHRKWT